MNLGDVAAIVTILAFLWPIAVAVLFDRGPLGFFRRKETRLFSNLKRPIAVIRSSKDNMDIEITCIKQAQFFTVIPMPADERSSDLIDGHYRLVILRYEDTAYFWKHYETLKQKNIPAIVYAKYLEIPHEQMEKIGGYSFHTICNNPLRLISDVFAIMSTFPDRPVNGARS
jgi:hypothetical protein